MAWILSLFGLDKVFVQGVNENFPGHTITNATYYLFFFSGSIVCGVIFSIVSCCTSRKLIDEYEEIV